MGRKIRDRAGERLGHLVVLKMVHTQGDTRTKRISWLCQCDCGNQVIMSQLHSPHRRSCGCLPKGRKPGHLGERINPQKEKTAWRNMKNRCLRSSYCGYSHYGGRGIKIYEEWIHSFKSFYDHVGPAPSPLHTLDRIRNDGNYEPGNVRWATMREQRRNSR